MLLFFYVFLNLPILKKIYTPEGAKSKNLTTVFYFLFGTQCYHFIYK